MKRDDDHGPAKLITASGWYLLDQLKAIEDCQPHYSSLGITMVQGRRVVLMACYVDSEVA